MNGSYGWALRENGVEVHRKAQGVLLLPPSPSPVPLLLLLSAQTLPTTMAQIEVVRSSPVSIGPKPSLRLSSLLRLRSAAQLSSGPAS